MIYNVDGFSIRSHNKVGSNNIDRAKITTPSSD